MTDYQKLNAAYDVLDGLFTKYKNAGEYKKMLMIVRAMKLLDEEQTKLLKEEK